MSHGSEGSAIPHVQGDAEEAIKMYVSLIPGSEVIDIVRHGEGAGEMAGRFMKATVSLAERRLCAR